MLPVFEQAMDDYKLPPAAKQVLWVLLRRLDAEEYREVKIASLAHECHLKDSTVSWAVTVLRKRGYIEIRPGVRRSRLFRLYVSRSLPQEKAA
jgi:DNA-binding MarR family transcriptional regulator